MAEEAVVNEFVFDKKNRSVLDLMAQIGWALSLEKDIGKLLELILKAARTITNADAGTLYILDQEKQELRFEIIQNDTLKVGNGGVKVQAEKLPAPIPLYIESAPNNSNVSSYVALTHEVVSIADVYENGTFNFNGPRNFDLLTGYRTKSMLCLPLTDPNGKTIGVLQLINSLGKKEGEVVSFSAEDVVYVRSLASQASVALRNTRLLMELSAQFEEVKGLERAEKALSGELKQAYLEAEKTNQALQESLRKIHVTRLTTAAFLLLFCLAVGWYGWNRKIIPDGLLGQGVESTANRSGVPAITLVPQAISATITMTGSFEPINIVNIPSPVAGKVKEVFFSYGEIVRQGQVILTMDTSEVEVRCREAETAKIKAVQHLKELEEWEDGPEVSRARRSLTRAKLALAGEKKTFADTERLYQKGIVPAAEYESSRQQYLNQEMDYQAIEEELRSTIARGGEENKRIARFERDNAVAKLNEAQSQLRQSTVVAPVSGLLLTNLVWGESREGKQVKRGMALQQGDILFALGNLSGYSIRSKIDETEVAKVAAGQKVKVTGDAFPGLQLEGRIGMLSSQAREESMGLGGAAAFDVSVVIDSLLPEQRKAVLVGMSANIEVVIYENPEALVLPVGAVGFEGGKKMVLRKGGGKVEVETGYTTLESVEIRQGLQAGDEILVVYQ